MSLLPKRPMHVMIIVGFLTLIAAIAMHFFYSQQAWVHWDEAVFVQWGYKTYNALLDQDFNAVWKITHEQGYTAYPPFQSWFLALILLPFGFSFSAVRAVWLGWFVAGNLLTALLAMSIAKKYRISIGILSACFYITSPIFLYLASIALKELMGTTLTILFFQVYFWAREGKRSLRYIVVSFILFLLFFAKYQYFVIPLATIGLDFGILFLTGNKKIKTITSGIFSVVPFGILAALWLFFPFNKFPYFYNAVINPPNVEVGALTSTLNYILYYPRGIFYLYGFSFITGGLFLFSLLVSVFYIRNYKIRVLWSAVLINIILATVHWINVHERYIANVMPFVFILSSFVFIDLVTKLHKKVSAFSLPLFIVIGCIGGSFLILDLIRLPSYVYSVATRRGLAFNMLDYNDAWFNYDISTWPRKISHSQENPDDVIKYIIQQVDLSKHVEVLGRSSEFSPPYVQLQFDFSRNNNVVRTSYPSYLVTIEILPTSRLYTFDYKVLNEFIVQYIRGVENNPQFVMLNHKRFEELGVEVKIYVPALAEKMETR